jgi:hypothetical protein
VRFVELIEQVGGLRLEIGHWPNIFSHFHDLCPRSE